MFVLRGFLDIGYCHWHVFHNKTKFRLNVSKADGIVRPLQAEAWRIEL